MQWQAAFALNKRSNKEVAAQQAFAAVDELMHKKSEEEGFLFDVLLH